MKKINAIVVDDEPLARDAIRVFLKKHPAIEIIAEGENGIEAVNLVQELNPDLLFLDIQMPELNGFDALNEIDSNVQPLIIFTTAFDKYALKAFETSAIDYLMKPFDQERFDRSIEKVTKYLHGINKTERTKLIDAYQRLIRETSDQLNYVERLMVKENRKLIPVSVKDVQVFEADSDYVVLNMGESKKKHLINNSLANLEKILNPAQFVRVHKSTIIKIDSIVEMKHHTNGEYVILMKNGMEVKLSRSYKNALERISS